MQRENREGTAVAKEEQSVLESGSDRERPFWFRQCGTGSRFVLDFSLCMGFIPRSTMESQHQSSS